MITGAASGIGEALSRKLDKLGAHVAATDVNYNALQKLQSSLHTHATIWQLDVADDNQVAQVAHEISKHYGKIDYVIANAGIGGDSAKIIDSRYEIYAKVLSVNLLGSINTARHFGKYLASSRGYFLQNASVGAIVPAAFMGAYSSSKAGVEAFARIFEQEMASAGVSVGIVYFPWMNTPMVRKADDDTAIAHMRKKAPWPFNKTYELDAAISRVIADMYQRKPAIYPIKWVRIAHLSRGINRGLITRFSQITT